MAEPEVARETAECMQILAASSGRIGTPDSAAHEALTAVMTKASFDLGGNDYHKDIDVSWSPQRRAAARILNSKASDLIVGFFILADLGLMMVKVDRKVLCTGKNGAPEADSNRCDANNMDMVIPEYAILVYYTIELMMRFGVFQLCFHKNIWNLIDLLIVCLGWLQVLIGAIGLNIRYVKLLRVLRAAKIFKILSGFRELYLLIAGFAATIKVVFWASLLLFVLLSMVSIVAVEVIHPINQRAVADGRCSEERCERAFSSVWQSNLSLFQIIILGDNWGTISTPVIEEEPGLALFFVGLALIIFMGYGNLIVGVIVERAMEAREQDKEYQKAVQKSEELETKKDLIEVCRHLDADMSGTLTKDELMSNVGTKMATALEQLNLKEKDLEVAFDCIDADKSGHISYIEFVEQLFDIKHTDMKMMLTFIRHDIKKGSDKLFDKFGDLSATIDNQMALIKALAQTRSHPWTKTEDLTKPLSPQSTAGNDAVSTTTSLQTDAYDNQRSAMLPCPKPLSARAVSTVLPQVSGLKAFSPQQPRNHSEDVNTSTEATMNRLMFPALCGPSLPDHSSRSFPQATFAATGCPKVLTPISETMVFDDEFEQKFMELRMKVEDKLSLITSDLLNRIACKARAMSKSTEMLMQLDTHLSMMLSYKDRPGAPFNERITEQTIVPALKLGASASPGGGSPTRSSTPHRSCDGLRACSTRSQDVQGAHCDARMGRLCNACEPSSDRALPVMRV